LWCLAVLLVGLHRLLRWRDRSGFEAATTGSWQAVFPLVRAWSSSRLACVVEASRVPHCATALSALVALPGGVVIAVRSCAGAVAFGSVAAAAPFSMLAASMGCLRLGALAVLSVRSDALPERH